MNQFVLWVLLTFQLQKMHISGCAPGGRKRQGGGERKRRKRKEGRERGKVNK